MSTRSSKAEHERVYLLYGKYAHLLPYLESPNQFGPALCGIRPRRFLDPWYGTGTYSETVRAKKLPLCPRCRRYSS
jgi:hypothetical protein